MYKSYLIQDSQTGGQLTVQSPSKVTECLLQNPPNYIHRQNFEHLLLFLRAQSFGSPVRVPSRETES